MDLLEDIDDPSIPLVQASNALGVSRATLYRRTKPPTPPTVSVRVPNPRRLSESERKTVLELLHSEQFADQPPPEVYATLLSQGVYLASIRTMYRLLAEQGESPERRAQRAPARHEKPTLTATAPNEVWTWDITKLQSAVPGVFFFLYMILDLDSTRGSRCSRPPTCSTGASRRWPHDGRPRWTPPTPPTPSASRTGRPSCSARPRPYTLTPSPSTTPRRPLPHKRKRRARPAPRRGRRDPRRELPQ